VCAYFSTDHNKGRARHNTIPTAKVRKHDTTVKGHKYTRWIVDYGVIDGKRFRRAFRIETAANEFIERESEKQKILARRIGRAARHDGLGNLPPGGPSKPIRRRDRR
jgi:hypothetical protein